MNRNKNNFFWLSYSDLMTSLFFVMFVLFIITFCVFQREQGDFSKQSLMQQVDSLQRLIKISEEEQKKLQELEYPSKYIDFTRFRYEEKYKRFALKRDIKFDYNVSMISESDLPTADSIGRSIVKMITDVRNDEQLKDLKPKYLVIIEGMASNTGGGSEKEKINYDLSYQRAYSLYARWRQTNGISRIIQNEDICEVIIAGSGWGGVGRLPMQGADDSRNQRFLIQIIPKISTVKTVNR